MFVLTIDQRDSRVVGDDVPRLLSQLAEVTTVRGFERTIGDEIQGVLSDPAAVARAVMRTASLGGWHIGVGVGDVDRPLPTAVAQGRGEAFYRARSAVDDAKTAPAHLVVEASGSSGELAQSALRLLIWTVESMRPESLRYISYRLGHPGVTQAEIAAEFDVSQQAVSRVLAQGGLEVVGGGLRLAAWHLHVVDGGDASEMAADESSPLGWHTA